MEEPINVLNQKLQQLEKALGGRSSHSTQIKTLCSHLKEIGDDAMTAGFPGIMDISMLVRDCLQAVADPDKTLNDADMAELQKWPGLLGAYFDSPKSEATQDGLLGFLRYPAWGSVLKPEDTDLLKSMLAMVRDAKSGSRRKTTELDIEGPGEIEQEQADELEIRISDRLPAQVRELLEIFAAELAGIHQAIGDTVNALLLGADEQGVKKRIKSLSKNLKRYGEAIKSIEFEELGEVIDHTRQNVDLLAEAGNEAQTAITELLLDWPRQILDYMQDPADKAKADSLLQFMQRDGWLLPLDGEQVKTLSANLTLSDFSNLEEEVPERQQQATPEDVSIELQDDINQDLLEGLLQELPGQTEELSAAIQRLIEGGTQDDVLIAKRIAHTLKGAGNTVGIRGIATLTHHLEDILLSLSKLDTLPTPRISETFLKASDCLQMMSEALLGLGEAPDDALEVLQEVLDLANLIDREGIKATTVLDLKVPALDQSAAGKTKSAPEEKPREEAKEPRDMAAQMMRVPAGFVDNLLRLVGESIIMTGQIRERIRLTLEETKNVNEQFELLQRLGAQLEEIIDVKDLTNLQKNMVRDDKYDSLEMDQYSELHTCSRRLVEAAVDASEISKAIFENLYMLDEMLVDQSRLNNETQEGVMRARMVPANSQFSRLQRSVRQAAKLTGKEVKLHLMGGETLMDSETLNNLLDPLMHLLRNAVDHGVEPPDERLMMEKPAEGNIYLEFTRDGNSVLVRCRDDGRGLDLGAIREKAIEQGLLTVDQEATDDLLKQMILRPNFSTRDTATQVSGRGIGMDAVYSRVIEMSGSFSLDSETGRGCTIEIRLPQTLISSHALLVRIGPQFFAVANRGIIQILHHETGEVREFGSELLFHVDNESYPVVFIENLLNLHTDRRASDRQSRSVLLVQSEKGKYAILVESIMGSQELVIKGLGHYITKLPGILGVTILGNGSVTPVLDLPDLLRIFDTDKQITTNYVRPKPKRVQLPAALVVDDSLSARRSLAQYMQDIGYDVRTARDGMEAFEIIKARKPDILLSDLEMPRMNGMELISHVRADKSIADIPFIMITSRAAAKHREEAMAAGVDVYLTKPYSEDELLEHIKKLQLG